MPPALMQIGSPWPELGLRFTPCILRFNTFCFYLWEGLRIFVPSINPIQKMRSKAFPFAALAILLPAGSTGATGATLDISSWLPARQDIISGKENADRMMETGDQWKSDGPFNSTDINYDGEIRVGDDDRSIKSISPGGYLKISIRTFGNIVLFYADGRVVYLFNDQGREYIIDFKMEELDEVLDPEVFFRINRSFTLNINFIRDVIVHSNSRLKIDLNRPLERELIVSREKVNSFKLWFGMR